MKYTSHLLQQAAWSLEIDLTADMQDLSYEKLRRAGYRNVSSDRALYQYFNVQKRVVERKPRKVHKSREFQCPQAYEAALANFEDRVRSGASLVPFLSDKLMDASYNDGMLNDWNIYHFHLTRQFRKDGWAKRSDYELFAYVTDTDMYFIQIYAHNDPLLYWRRDIIRILYDNWPDVLEKFHLKDVTGLTEKFDDEQYRQLREAHATTLVELGEKQVFGLIGGGYMSDGSSAEALRSSDFWHNRLRKIQEIFVENMDKLCEVITQTTNDYSREYKVKLLWVDNEQEFTFCELNRQVIIQLNLEEGYWRVCRPGEVFGGL